VKALRGIAIAGVLALQAVEVPAAETVHGGKARARDATVPAREPARAENAATNPAALDRAATEAAGRADVQTAAVHAVSIIRAIASGANLRHRCRRFH
jgi:hypothetical protein